MTTETLPRERSATREADLAATMAKIGRRARAAAAALALASAEAKVEALREGARAVRDRVPEILAANARDLAEAEDLSPALRDRLALDPRGIEAIAAGLEAIAELPDPVGRVLAQWTRPNGLAIERVAVPLGVIGIIYESRPNVTADAGGLALKSGNAAILRGGSESFHSSRALLAALRAGLQSAGLPEDAIQLVPTRDRAAVGLMLAMSGVIDIIVPRGGASLIERVQRESRIPVIAHLEGLCHTYVDAAADPEKARKIVLNAKMRRVSICGATETLLVDRRVAATILPSIFADLRAAGCELRGDPEVLAIDPAAVPAIEQDWHTEYLDTILAIRVVDGVDEAIAHIERCGSHHTDAIVTEDQAVAERFLREVDSAIVLVNASTQFADGGEFGMGAEIGISTQRLPPRGPVGAAELTTYKYLVRGSGLLGGSFNPAHGGHLHLSLLAVERLDLDEVWWLVSPQNPLKPVAGMAPFADRLDQARRVAAGQRRIIVSDLEIRLGGRHYTADTLHALRRRFPRLRFVWLMGADNLIQLRYWQRWREIFRSAAIAVFDRPSYSLKALSGLPARRFARQRVPPSAARRLAEVNPPAWVFFHSRLDPRSATRIRTEGKRSLSQAFTEQRPALSTIATFTP